MARIILVVVVAAACVAGNAHGEPADSTTSPLDTVYTVPGIVIEAPRVPLHVDDVFRRPGFVAVLDLAKRNQRVEDLSTVLSQMVGVRVRQYGGLGSFATVSIRGSSANQVDVYLDGIALNDAYSGLTNLGDLPLDGMERVEVYRGFAPPQLGASSIGGAVNLVTPQPGSDGAPRFQLSESRGSFDTARHVMSLWASPGPAKLFLHGSFMKSAGDFEFIDNLGTPQNPADDVTTRRINNDFDQWNLIGRLAASIPRAGSVTVGHNSVIREQGVPGIGSNQSQTARAKRTRHLTSVQWTLPETFDGRLQTFARGFHSTANERFYDPDGDISFFRQDTDNDFRTTGGSARVKLEAPLLPLALEALYEGRHESFFPHATLPQPSDGPERKRVTHRGLVSGDLYLFRQNLVLTATQRFIAQTTEFYDPPTFPWLPPSPQGKQTTSDGAPQVGFRWHPASFMTVKGNWGRYYRQPTMLELFGNVGSITGSVDIVAERGTNRDIGVVLSRHGMGVLQSAFLEVVYLENDADDLIAFLTNSQFSSRPENISSAHIEGWEVSFATHWQQWLRVAGNYSYLDGRNISPIPYYDGNALPGRPTHDAALFVDTLWRRWKFSYELHYLGANYLDLANMQEVPAREIHNAAVRVGLFDNVVSLTAGGANLGNNQISDVSGFPLPGRSFYVTLGLQP